MNLQSLLEPRSVALVGASAEPGKLSGMIVGFLAASGYTGRVYAVNPRYERIGSLACYASVEALPETVDLVVCVVPVAAAFAAIEAAARRGVPYCLLMTGGFGEGRTGAEGEARRQRLLDICRRSGMHVVGPNTVGMVNFRARLPLTFADWYARDTGRRGGVAIVTHSGSVGGLLFSSLQSSGIGVDYWFGLGNEATLETADFIAHFNSDPSIHTVVCYLEGIGSGRKFIQAAEQARSLGKRILAIRAGGHPESARSTRSHTAKDPAPCDVYAGIFRQIGVIDVASLAEAAYAMVLLTSGARLGRRIGILSASGGACSLLADHVIDAGLELPELSPALQHELDQAIPQYGSSLNPVDLSADVVSRAEILHGTLAALAADDRIDVWLVFGRPIVDRYAPALIEFARASGKTVVVSCGVPPEPAVCARLRDAGIAVLDDPQLCLRALGRIQRAASGSDAAGFAAADPSLPAGEGRAGRDHVADKMVSWRRAHPRRASNASEHSSGNTTTPPLPASSREPSNPSVHAAIEDNRDFGPVLTLFGDRSRSRIVRALPLTSEELRDAVHELAADGHPGLCVDALVSSLQTLVESARPGAELHVDRTPAS
jgi:acyl-CoA synthetase (NDP forming)